MSNLANKAIVIEKYGDADVLKYLDYPVGSPEKGQVLVRHSAIGLNFIDVYHRTGLYPNNLPFVPGLEAAGVIEEVGQGVSDFQLGDRVVYRGALGAYSQRRVVAAHHLIPIPEDIDDNTAAALCLKGLTVRALLFETFAVKPGDKILFHAAAGGVGQIACAWAKSLGAEVIGTVGSDQKAEVALQNGCDHVINLRRDNFAERVLEITHGNGVDVVYDSIGKDSFEASLDCLRPRGLMVSFGNSSGPVSVPTLGILASKGSLFVTRPTMAHYYPDQQSQLDAAKEMFNAFREQKFSVNIGQTFALSDAADAHRALENRQTVGATILLP